MNQHPGVRLKQIRLDKGLSLEAVQKQTRINAQIIQALEGDGISTVSPVYLRSFLKLYCAFLGVDPKEFLAAGETRPREQEPKPAPAPLPASPRRVEAPAPVRQAAAHAEEKKETPVQAPRREEPARRERNRLRRVRQARKVSRRAIRKVTAYTLAFFDVCSQRAVAGYRIVSLKVRSIRISRQTRLRLTQAAVALVVLLVVIKIIAAAAGAVRSAVSRRQAKRARAGSLQTQKKAPAVAAAAPARASAPKAAVSGSQSDEARKAAETFAPVRKEEPQIRLIIRAKENSWVSLKSDGKVVFQRILEKGRFETWEARERMELSVGNAGGIELDVNGKVVSNLGRRRQALRNIVITKDGLQIQR